MNEESSNNMKGYNTIISGTFGAMVGVMVTYFTAIAGQQTELATLTEKVTNFDTKLSSLEAGLMHAYRDTDAKRDFDLVDLRIDNNAKHIEKLTKMIEEHVKEHGGP